MSQFKRDITEKMRNPEYAYEFGRAERELEIIKLLEGMSCGHYCRCMAGELCDSYAEAIALIKGENK